MKLWWTSQNHMKSWKKSKSYEIIIRFLRICKNWRKRWVIKRRRRLRRTTESSASANCAGTNFISIQKCSNTNLQQAMSRLSRPCGPHAQVNKRWQMKRQYAQVNIERPMKNCQWKDHMHRDHSDHKPWQCSHCTTKTAFVKTLYRWTNLLDTFSGVTLFVFFFLLGLLRVDNLIWRLAMA